MHRFLLLVVALAPIFVVPTAEGVPSCASAGDVAKLTDGCDLGPLHFDNFFVSPTGVAANVFLGAATTVTPDQASGGEATLGFQVATVPAAVTSPSDILLRYAVTTLDGKPLIGGINLANAGMNTTISETACGAAFVGGVCPSGQLLATLLVGPNSSLAAAFSPDVAALYISKDIVLAGLPNAAAFISEFENSHELGAPTPTPEPSTLLLLGTVMAGLGMAHRKRRRKA